MDGQTRKPLVGYKEMAGVLGIEVRTLKAYVQRRVVPSYKFGEAQNARRKFDVDEVLTALREPARDA